MERKKAMYKESSQWICDIPGCDNHITIGDKASYYCEWITIEIKAYNTTKSIDICPKHGHKCLEDVENIILGWLK